jgi:hypothetical protein
MLLQTARHVQTQSVPLHPYTLRCHDPTPLEFLMRSVCQLFHHYAQERLLDMQPFVLRREMSCLHLQAAECVTSHIPISTKLNTLERHPTRMWKETASLYLSCLRPLHTFPAGRWFKGHVPSNPQPLKCLRGNKDTKTL